MLGLSRLLLGCWWLDIGASSKRAYLEAALGLEPAAGGLVLRLLVDMLDSFTTSLLSKLMTQSFQE